MALADRYDLVELLGQGSFGQVFRATDRHLRRAVAIKILHRPDDDARRRFYREGVVLHSQLANEYVIALLDHAGLNDETPYLVLEFCELKSLRPWVGAQRQWRDVATALLHAAKGLAGVHAVGGLHRDVKPENMLVARVPDVPGWRVKLADFGLAGFPHPVTGHMTRSGAGTDGYIAPEILAGAPFHAPADVYSLGIVGVELLVGRIDSLGLQTCRAPTALIALVRAMISGLPQARPTATAVIEKLEVLLVEGPLPSFPTLEPPTAAPRQEKKGTTWASVFAAVGMGALLIGAVNWLSAGPNRGPDGRFR